MTTQGAGLEHRWGVIFDSDHSSEAVLLSNFTLPSQTISHHILRNRTVLVQSATHRSPIPHNAPIRTIVQPSDRGTLPGVLWSLLHIAREDRNATVAFFPSDRFYSSEPAFLAAVQEAFDTASVNPETIILLGAKPSRIAPELGYIEPRRPVLGGTGKLSRVKSFIERPPVEEAAKLISDGWLWNTFVMFGRVSAYLSAIRKVEPVLFDVFSATVQDDFGDNSEGTRGFSAMDSVYKKIDGIDFSRRVLATSLDRLAVLPIEEIEWNDLADPDRVLRVIEEVVEEEEAHDPFPGSSQTKAGVRKVVQSTLEFSPANHAPKSRKIVA